MESEARSRYKRISFRVSSEMTAIHPSDLEKIIQAILKAQRNTQWKPQKAEPHLKKRIRLGRTFT
jgi:hypothetical protein